MGVAGEEGHKHGNIRHQRGLWAHGRFAKAQRRTQKNAILQLRSHLMCLPDARYLTLPIAHGNRALPKQSLPLQATAVSCFDSPAQQATAPKRCVAQVEAEGFRLAAET